MYLECYQHHALTSVHQMSFCFARHLVMCRDYCTVHTVHRHCLSIYTRFNCALCELHLVVLHLSASEDSLLRSLEQYTPSLL